MDVNINSLKGWRTFLIFFTGMIGGIALMFNGAIPEFVSLEAYSVFVIGIGVGYGTKSVMETKYANKKNPTG